VPAAAPRIHRRLLEALIRLDDRTVPIAETCRRIGAEADRRGLTRPSYQRVRVLVHESRRARRGPTTTSVLLDVMARSRPPEALIDHAAGIPLPELMGRYRPK
jgi:hypothetical protein